VTFHTGTRVRYGTQVHIAHGRTQPKKKKIYYLLGCLSHRSCLGWKEKEERGWYRTRALEYRIITSNNNVNPTVAESLRPKVKPCAAKDMPGCLGPWVLGFLGLETTSTGQTQPVLALLRLVIWGGSYSSTVQYLYLEDGHERRIRV